MITMTKPKKTLRFTVGKVGLTLTLATTVTACNQLLEVELPGAASEEEVFLANQAGLLVNSAIADIECALSDFIAFEGAGYEDVATRTVGWWGGRIERPPAPGTGSTCQGTDENAAPA